MTISISTGYSGFYVRRSNGFVNQLFRFVLRMSYHEINLQFRKAPFYKRTPISFSVLLFGVSLAAMAAPACGAPLGPRSVVEGIPTYVIDGDTLRFGNVRVRLYGIDAPELRDERGRSNDAGEGAKRALRRLVEGRPIRCAGVGQPLSYGRLVALCHAPDGRELSHAIVAQGWAHDVAKFSGGRYLPAELAARRARRGMFAHAPSR